MAQETRQLRKDTQATKLQLIKAAEKLFAEKGIANVTLAEINLASGQKNRSALQYHFGGKQQLLEVISHKHLALIDIERNKMLDQLQGASTLRSRDVAAAVVQPLANRLFDADGGIEFIRITAQLINSGDFDLLHVSNFEDNPFAKRMWSFVQQVTPQYPPQVQLSRTVLIVSLLFHGLSDYAGIVSRDNVKAMAADHDMFIQDLIDCVDALMMKKPSKRK